ncbi:MAG: MarR family transcriptional regulator [Myxococcaceae bacterium]|nr:MarR family transcriptional regulator [Myxococcaceae bacterium]
MNSSRDALIEQLWPRMMGFTRRMQAGMAGGLGPLAVLNLTVPQAMALFRLAERPRTIGELQEATGRSQAATSHGVAALEKKKLVARGTDPEDARRTVVQLTPRARGLLGQVEGLRVKTFEEVMAPVPTELLQRLDRAFTDLLQAMEPK